MATSKSSKKTDQDRLFASMVNDLRDGKKPDKTPTQEAYDTLAAELEKTEYVPKTEEELRQEAADRYNSVYAAREQSTQQAADTSMAALDRQLSSLGAGYDAQREASTEAYNRAYSQAGRQAVKQGMGRSSYNLATQANISTAGNEALQEISDRETTARTGIEEQKSLLATQLAQTLQQYANSKTSDTNAYLDTLLSREYDRQQAANAQALAISQQMYQNRVQEDRDRRDDKRWQQEYNTQQEQFDRLHPKKKSGGDGSKGGGNGGGGGKGAEPEYKSLPDLWNLLGVKKEELSAGLSNPKWESSGKPGGGRYAK